MPKKDKTSKGQASTEPKSKETQDKSSKGQASTEPKSKESQGQVNSDGPKSQPESVGQRESATPANATSNQPDSRPYGSHHKHSSHDHHEVFSMQRKKQTEFDYQFDHWENVIEEAEPYEGEYVGELVFEAESFLRIFLHVIGRFPLVTKSIKNGYVDLEFKWKSPQAIYFAFTSALIFYLFGMGLLNLGLMGYNILDGEEDQRPLMVQIQRVRESACFHRGFLLVFITAMNIFNATVVQYILIRKRRAFMTSTGIWTRSLQNSQLDGSPSIFRDSAKAIGVCVLLALFVIPGALFKLATMINGSLTVAVVYFRLFSPMMLLPDRNNQFNSEFNLYMIAGIVLTVLSFLWSRSLILVYYIKIKEIINAVGMWNGRVYSAVLRSDHPQLKETRTTYQLLFKDHCVLIDMVDSVNNLFEGILESYYATHALSFIFETFFFFVVLRQGERLDFVSLDHLDDQGEFQAYGQFFIRRYDIISGIVIFLLDQIFYFMTIFTSTEVGEEVMGGLEIARRTSLIGRRTDEELFFLLSLFYSYNRFHPREMEGGGYFSINKELFVTFMVVLVLAIVIGLMFRPIFDWPNDREIVGPFITALEGIPDCHWRVTSKNWTTCNA